MHVVVEVCMCVGFRRRDPKRVVQFLKMQVESKCEHE